MSIVDARGQPLVEGITQEMLEATINQMPREDVITLRQMEQAISELMKGQAAPPDPGAGLIRQDAKLTTLRHARDTFIRRRYLNHQAEITGNGQYNWPGSPSTPEEEDNGAQGGDDEEDEDINAGEEVQILPGPVRPQGQTQIPRERDRRRTDEGQSRQGERAGQAAVGYAPMVYLHSAPDIGIFQGKREEDWQKFRTKLVAHFRATGQTDQMAAEQFSRYLEGPAYQYWDTLSDHIKGKLNLLIKYFNSRYSDEMRQEYYQQQFDNLQYMGYEKETLDDFAARLITVVAKAYPDYYNQDGKFAQRREMRKIYVRRKFWECMTPDMRQAMFIYFQSREASLKKQLAYARILQAAKLQNRQEEQPYETACYMDAGLPNEMLAELTTVMKTQGKEIKELRDELRKRDEALRQSQSSHQTATASAAEPKPPKARPPQQQSTSDQGARQSNFDITKVRCHGCGEYGHIRRNCPVPKKDQKPKPRDDRRDRPSDNRDQNKDRRERSYDRRDRDNDRGEWRRGQETRRDDRGDRDRREDSRDGDRREGQSQQRSWRGRQDREYSEDRRRDEPRRQERRQDDRRERKTPMNTMPIDRVSNRAVRREALNLLAQLEDSSDDGGYQDQGNC